MKFYKTLTLSAASIALSMISITSMIATTSSTLAATLDFQFSFNNAPLNGGGMVTGIIRGLVDNSTSAATSVEVLTHTTGFGLGEYVGNPAINFFTLSNGNIIDFGFLSLGSNNTSPDVTSSTLTLGFSSRLGTVGPGLSNSPSSFNTNSPLTLQLTRITPVPEPGMLVGIVATGLGLVAAKKRKQSSGIAA